MKIWIKRTVVSLFILTSLLFGALGSVLLTPAGLKFTLWSIHSVLPQFSIKSSEGSLLNGFTLKGVSYQSEAFSFTGKMLSLEFDKVCFIKSTLCVKTLRADGVDVVVPENALPDETQKEPSQTMQKIASPIPVFLKDISLSDISLDILGNKVHWNSLTTAIEFQGQDLILKPTLLEGFDFILATTKEKAIKGTQKNKNNVKQPLILPEVTFPLNVFVDSFELKNAQIALPEKERINQVILKGHISENKVEIKTFFLDHILGKVTANGQVTLKGEYPLALNANVDIKSAPLNGHSISLAADGNLGALNMDLKMKGTLQADISVSVDALSPLLPFNVLFISPHLQWPINSDEKYRLSSTHLTLNGNLDAYRATLKTAIFGEGIPEGVLQSKFNGDVSHISLIELNLDTLDGKIQGSGNINWEEGVEWQSRINLNKIKPGLQWSQLKGGILSGQFESHGRLNDKDGWIVKLPSVDLHGKYRKKTFSLMGEVEASDIEGKGNIRVETKGISLHHGQNIIDLKGTIGKQLALDLVMDLPNLTDFSSKIKGKIKGKVDIWGTLKAPNASFDLEANDLGVQKTVSIKTMDLRGSLKSTPLISGGLLLKVKGIKAEGVDISQLNLRVSGDEKEHVFSLKAKGKPVSANLNIRGSLKSDNYWEGQLYSSDLQTPMGPWKLKEKVALAFDSKTKIMNVGVFCWLQKKSKLCLDKPAAISDSGQANVSLSHFSLQQLQNLLPETLSVRGALNAKVNLDWSPKTLPNIDAQITLKKGALIPEKGKPLMVGWDEILLNLKLKNEKLNAKVNIDLTDNGNLALHTQMINLSDDERGLKSELDIRDLNIDILSSLLGPGAIIEGMINSHLTIENKVRDGTLDLPKAKGNISISKLKLRSLLLPIEVKDGGITLQLEGSKAEIKGEIKTADGDVLLLGRGQWSQLDKTLASFTLKGKDIKVVVPPMVTLKVSPDITLKLTQKELNVTGKINVPWGRIVVDSLPVSAVKISSDVVILNDKLQPIKKEHKNLLIINAQIGVTIADDVTLDAFGLKSDLIGNLNVQSDQYGQKVAGEINLEKGTFRSFGQDLLIKKGQIIFNGPPDQPYIQIEAVRNPDAIEDDVEAGIRLSGPADAPEMEIFSKPAMAQANALSYLTRGRNLNSTSDGNVMTSMLIGLGLSQSQKLVGQIGDAVGVDDFSLDTSGTGNDEKVEVSGYILPGLQVKYGVGIFTRLPEFKVRYRLIKNLYVEAVSGTDNAIDLLYQFTVK